MEILSRFEAAPICQTTRRGGIKLGSIAVKPPVSVVAVFCVFSSRLFCERHGITLIDFRIGNRLARLRLRATEGDLPTPDGIERGRSCKRDLLERRNPFDLDERILANEPAHHNAGRGRPGWALE